MKDREFFRVYDEVLKRPACVRPTPQGTPVQVYERSARLNHPNILAIYEVRSDDLITEAVAGTRLSDFLDIRGDRRAFTSRFQEKLIGPLLRAVSYANENGVVHGFLHPGNVWLFPHEQVKVWGFGFTGLEAARGDEGWDLAAPEVRRGEKPSVRSDVWSVGAILHLLFTGRLPTAAVDESVPEWLRGCLMQDPAERYPSCWKIFELISPMEKFEMDAAEESMLHTTLANNYFRQFKVELAVLEWEKALAVYPEDRVARNNLGVALWRGGRVEEAAECFRRAGSFFNLGLLLLKQGDFAVALEPLRTSIMLVPERAAGYLAYGECLLGLGRARDAIEEFHKALILNIQWARTFQSLAQAYEILGKLEEAEQYREKSLEATDRETELQPLILETPLA